MEVVAAFCAGLRLARATGLDRRIRDEPLLLRLLTVDGGPVLAAASDQLATAAHDLDPTVDDRAARETAELLVRLAISLVLDRTSKRLNSSHSCAPLMPSLAYKKQHDN